MSPLSPGRRVPALERIALENVIHRPDRLPVGLDLQFASERLEPMDNLPGGLIAGVHQPLVPRVFDGLVDPGRQIVDGYYGGVRQIVVVGCAGLDPCNRRRLRRRRGARNSADRSWNSESESRKSSSVG